MVKNCHQPILTHEMFDMVQKERGKFKAYIQRLSLEQYESACCKKQFHLPHQLAEYNDTVARHVLGTVKVLSQDRLLVIFKGGDRIEQDMKQ